MTKYIETKLGEVNYEEVCSYYNRKKHSEWPNITRIERAEGGFSVGVNDERQLRWEARRLVTPIGICTFLEEEEALLFESLQFIHGKTNFTYYEGPLYRSIG